MAGLIIEARKRQLVRLGGATPPAPRAAMALAISQAYQDDADAPSNAADLAHYKAWCDRHGFVAMPAMPEVVGAYLAAAGEGYAMPTLRRRVAAIARACGVAGHPLDSKHPAIRETLRGIGRKHGSPPRRAAALTTAKVRRLTRACGEDLAGKRERALLLMGFAGALRRSELVALDIEHIT
jgi:integrase